MLVECLAYLLDTGRSPWAITLCLAFGALPLLVALYRLFTEDREFPAWEITLPTAFNRPTPSGLAQGPALALHWTVGFLTPGS